MMNESPGSVIPSRSFYGDRKFRAPALVPGIGSKAALKAARTDPGRLLRSFVTQQEAFDFCDSRPGSRLRIWSFEIDNNGRRRYAVASYQGFWRFYSRFIRRGTSLHFYEVLRERHACKLYFDLEFIREYNPSARAEEMIDAIVTTSAEIAGVLVRRDSNKVTELDSTTDKKFSRHLIFEEIAFHDNAQVGDFVRRVLEAVVDRNENLALVRNKDGVFTSFVDQGVYTRNRCFRLVGSSKFGKVQRLVPVGSTGRLSFSKDYFLRSLVCNVGQGVVLRGTATPIENFPSPQFKFRQTPQNGGQLEQRRDTGSPFSKLDEYVLSIIEPSGGGIYGITVMAESDTVMYAIKGGYKYCANVGRHHKSNNVILVADLITRCMYQKCFDPDCRGFRSAAWELPEWVLGSAAEDVSDEAVIDMMERYEARDSVEHEQFEEEQFEEALDAMMDDLMSNHGCQQRQDQ